MYRNRFLHRAVTAAALAAAPLGLVSPAPAFAGPQEPNALQVIMALQRQGDKVIVNRTGSKPLQMCTVTSIREINAQYWWTRTQVLDPRPAKRPSAVGPQLIIRTVRVDIRC